MIVPQEALEKWSKEFKQYLTNPNSSVNTISTNQEESLSSLEADCALTTYIDDNLRELLFKKT